MTIYAQAGWACNVTVDIINFVRKLPLVLNMLNEAILNVEINFTCNVTRNMYIFLTLGVQNVSPNGC